METELQLYKEQAILKMRERMIVINEKAIEKIYLDSKIAEYRALIDSKEPIDNEMLISARESMAISKKLQKQKITSEYYFVTVAPKTGTTLEELKSKVEKYINRRMVCGSMYSFEWTKEKQVHVHLIVHQIESSDRDFRKNTKNTFKNLVGNLTCIDVRAIPEDWLDDKKAYIMGEKWDDDKQEMIEYDKQKRIDEGLSPYYQTGTFVIPRPTTYLDEDGIICDNAMFTKNLFIDIVNAQEIQENL